MRRDTPALSGTSYAPPALRVPIRVAIQPDIVGHRRAEIRADRASVRGKCAKLSRSQDGPARLESVWGRKALVSSNLTPSVASRGVGTHWRWAAIHTFQSERPSPANGAVCHSLDRSRLLTLHALRGLYREGPATDGATNRTIGLASAVDLRTHWLCLQR
jgi:hypothetical protein